MMKTTYIYTIGVSLLLTVACTREQDPLPATPSLTRAVISPDLLTTATDAGATEADFPTGSTIGLFFMQAGRIQQADAHSYYYNFNAKATRETTGWVFSHDSLGAITAVNVVFQSEGGAVDSYAYAPHISGVTDLTAIPFKTVEQKDILWAAPQTNTTIAGQTAVTFPLHFKHLMSCLRFKIAYKYYQENSALKIRSIILSKVPTAGTDTHLYDQGVLDVTTGKLNALHESGKITIPFSDTPLGAEGSETEFNVLIPPCDFGDEQLEVSILLASLPNTPLPVAYKIKHTDIKLSDPAGTETGFQAGYRYTFRILIDNYIKFEDSINIDNTWETIPGNITI